MAIDALWPSPGATSSSSLGSGSGAGGLRWLEGPSPLVSSRALLPLHAPLTLSVLHALQRMPRLDPPPAAVLARVVAEYPRLKLAGTTHESDNNSGSVDEKKTQVGR